VELLLSSFLLLLLSACEEPSDCLFLGVGSKKELRDLMPSDLTGMGRASPPQKKERKRRSKGAARLANSFPIVIQNSTSPQKSHTEL